MPNYPTPLNPAILLYTGTIPAMKNSIQVRQNPKTLKVTGVGRKKSVQKDMTKMAQLAKQQWDAQGFDKIEETHYVGIFVSLGVYISKDSDSDLPNSDLDNSYTTIQETLQNSIIDNDRQIVDLHATRKRFSNIAIPEYSLVFLWAIEKEKVVEDELFPIKQFTTFLHEFYSNKTSLELLTYARSRRNTHSRIFY